LFGSRRALLNKVLKGVPLTITRASTANLPDGTSVPPNTGRFVTIAGKRGILIEEGTTNILTAFASLPTTASMIMTSTDGGNLTYSYDVVNFSEKLQNNSAVLNAIYAGAKTYTITHSTMPISSGQPYTATIWGGSIGGTSTLIAINWFDSTSTYISSETKGITPNTAGKFTITGTAPANAVRGQAVLKGILNQGEKLFWNAGQFENKAYNTSFTLGGTTRQPETLSMPASILNLSQGTIELEFYMPITMLNQTTTNQGLLYHAVNPNRLGAYINNGIIQFYTRDDVGNTSQVSSSKLVEGMYKVAMSWNSDKLTAYINGIKINEVQNPHLPSTLGTTLNLGFTSGNYCLNSIIRNICVSKIKRTDTDMQARSQANTYPLDNQVTAFALLESDIRGVASA